MNPEWEDLSDTWYTNSDTAAYPPIHPIPNAVRNDKVVR